MKLWPWSRRAVPLAIPLPQRAPLTPEPLNFSLAAEAMRADPRGNLPRGYKELPRHENPFRGLPKPPPGVRPEGHPVPIGMAMDTRSAELAGMATDDAFATTPGWGAWAQGGLWGEGLFFPGYAYLAELQQRSEYRNIVATVAEEMTRKWINLVSTGDDDKEPTIKKLEAAMQRHRLKAKFRRASQLDGAMGMAFIYMDFGCADNPEELRSSIMDIEGNLLPEKITRGSLKYFQVVDPTWVSPVFYNSTDPLKPDYFIPSLWYIMGKQVHASRLLIIRSREVPDILKAAYNFGGVSLAQMSKPSVDNWLRTRQSVSDLLHAFTTWVLKTNMQAYVQNTSMLMHRLSLFILGRDNKGLMVVDKDTEELDNVSAPLGGLDHLQAQAQEQQFAVSKEPLTKALGYVPSGLSNTDEAGIRNWYDHVHAEQEAVYDDALRIALQVIQLSELGTIDEEIDHEFVPLWELDEAGKAAIEKTKADTDAVLMQDGVIDNDEARTRIRNDPASPYHGLEGDAPDPPMMQMGGNEGDDPTDKIDRGGAEGSEVAANSGV
jgi:hypothetical protein